MNLSQLSELTGFISNGVYPSEIPFYKAAAEVAASTDEIKRMQARLLYQSVLDAGLPKNAGFYLSRFLKDQPDGEWYPEIDALLTKSAYDVGSDIFNYLLTNEELVKTASPLTSVMSSFGAAGTSIPKTVLAAVLLLSASLGGTKWMLDREIGVGSPEEEALKTKIDTYVSQQLREEKKNSKNLREVGEYKL